MSENNYSPNKVLECIEIVCMMCPGTSDDCDKCRVRDLTEQMEAEQY